MPIRPKTPPPSSLKSTPHTSWLLSVARRGERLSRWSQNLPPSPLAIHQHGEKRSARTIGTTFGTTSCRPALAAGRPAGSPP
ncbi:unnamed protein product [Closterium sp. Yama58-4]|nr:unnamed protein product [Closterium sp. Yama58-4]